MHLPLHFRQGLAETHVRFCRLEFHRGCFCRVARPGRQHRNQPVLWPGRQCGTRHRVSGEHGGPWFCHELHDGLEPADNQIIRGRRQGLHDDPDLPGGTAFVLHAVAVVASRVGQHTLYIGTLAENRSRPYRAFCAAGLALWHE